jgi:hypothetical protein
VIVGSKKRVHVNPSARPEFLAKSLLRIDPEQGHRPTVSRVEGSIYSKERSFFGRAKKPVFRDISPIFVNNFYNKLVIFCNKAYR